MQESFWVAVNVHILRLLHDNYLRFFAFRQTLARGTMHFLRDPQKGAKLDTARTDSCRESQAWVSRKCLHMTTSRKLQRMQILLGDELDYVPLSRVSASLLFLLCRSPSEALLVQLYVPSVDSTSHSRAYLIRQRSRPANTDHSSTNSGR
jgi:hypothetical protein